MIEILACLFVMLFTALLAYYAVTISNRHIAKQDGYGRLFIRRTFIYDMLIPFRGWIIWLIDLFRDEAN